MTEPSKPTPQQVWAARLLLGWSRERLAARSGTTMTFVWTYENEGRVIKMYSREQSLDGLAAIRSTLESAGVEFIEENGGGPGVRLGKLDVQLSSRSLWTKPCHTHAVAFLSPKRQRQAICLELTFYVMSSTQNAKLISRPG